jgi:hypothetical protein
MATTKQDIREWLEQGKGSGVTHVIVVCDTYDWTDYPVFVMEGEDVRTRMREYDGANMQKVMEVYNLSMDMETQLDEHRALNY